MPDKQKLITIALAAVLLVLMVVGVALDIQLRKVRKERDGLQVEKLSLTGQVTRLTSDNKNLKVKLEEIQKQVENLTSAKAQLEANVTALTQEKAALAVVMEQLKAQLANATQPSEGGKFGGTDVANAQADIYWANLLKKKAELELRLDTLRQELNSAKLENDRLRQEKNSLELDMKSFRTDDQEFKREYDYNKKLADTLTQELTREKNDKFRMQETLKALQSENATLKQQVKTLYDRKVRLEEKFIALQKKNAELENNLGKMEGFVRQKIMQVDSLRQDLGVSAPVVMMPSQRIEQPAPSREPAEKRKEAIELQPIVVRPAESLPDAAAERLPTVKSGSIVAINKENNFVIVNMGENAGIKVGDTFQVYRRDAPIASLEVIQVRQNISACDIKSENFPIIVGDAVR